MEMSLSLTSFLKTHQSIFIDTNVIIHFVEAHPDYAADCRLLFQRIESGQVQAFTSTLSLIETLVQPYRLGKEELVHRFYALLTTYPNLTWAELTIAVADHAARLRAEYRLKTPDAIQAATALTLGVAGFVTCDKEFRKVAGLDCCILDAV